MKRCVIVRFRCEPRGAQLRRALGSCYTSIGKILLQPPAKRVCVNRVAVKEATHQHDLWREQMQPLRDHLCVFAKDACPFFYDLHHPGIAGGASLKYHWSE